MTPNRCEHGRQRYTCKECGGGGVCEHGRQRSTCKECGGSQICKHGIGRQYCKECGGSSICKHYRNRNFCKECGGNQICKHRRQRSQCKECGGFQTAARSMLRNAKARAKNQDLPFTITVKEILELIGNGVCPVLGITYDLTLRKVSSNSPSLDRFNPALGYVKGNCSVISQMANKVKSNATTEEVGRVYHWMLSQENS